ncbi:PDGLE domain-containing protein [Gordonia sp. DT30]|uniref:PDGLE domain-containing protein n=1 Tax=unclassified Gordonia (in: high G+C Gram-positive bacteria) TaxID=2657482 RepID=UPI003CED9650
MSASGSDEEGAGTRRLPRRRTVLVVFAVVALLIAGVVSYLASSSPDGLDSATRQGCGVTDVNGTEHLTGTCIAQHATDHAMASSPLAHYAFRGIGYTNGIAGIIGVIVTLVIAGALFWVIGGRRRGGSARPPEPGAAPTSRGV